ncbi:hypothetical protein EP47_14295 [Legionella norrlandica]|uniref:Dot/Icm T4SS effector n=1 Tax=Legionella norrlandica TaxID=1498499 RepID=A0A0A2SQ35_9GAMM|nr:hypothetical protein [Legionella norrlandica]KGP62847.1 hypothetical protein EP47_14295 [Legionella norrlandica]
MLDVDNSGKGNCMYYAYSISLMYYLRAKNDSKTTEDIFNKLKLNEDQKKSLRTLLSQEPHNPFSKHEIKSIIEPVLGRATRNLAGERTVEEFNANPYATPLFTAAKYGLEHYFKQSLQSNGSELANFIDHGFTDPDYTEAEIYRVAGMESAMEKFAAARLPVIVQEFNKQWAEKEKKFEGKAFSKSDIQFHKSILLDDIMSEEIVEFFSANDSKYLNDYKKHLQKEYVWGTEETLMTLHRGIQGERMERNKQGTIDTFHDTAIVLHIHRDGSSPFFQSGTPEMILNNCSNVHWTSKIPDSVFSPRPPVVSVKKPPEEKIVEQPLEKTIVEHNSPLEDEESYPPQQQMISSDLPQEVSVKEDKLFKILDDMKVACDNIPTDHREFNIIEELINNLETQIGIIASKQHLEKKEMAVDRALNFISSASPKLGEYQSWGTLFKNFLSSLLDCIPSFLGGNQIRSGLTKLGIYKEDRRPEIFRAIERVSNKILDAINEQTKSIEENEESIEEAREIPCPIRCLVCRKVGPSKKDQTYSRS